MITVIIPTYKRSQYLQRAIESVINQSCFSELIVVDDNDCDTEYRENNEILMKKYEDNKRIVYVKHKSNRNGAAARNTGIKYSSNEYVTFLDDDDIFLPNRLEEICKVIKEQKPDFICTGVIVKEYDKLVNIIIPKNKDINKLILELLLQNSFFVTGSNLVCKKSIIRAIDGFDEFFLRNQDIEFMIRYLAICNSVYVIQKPLVVKNMYDNMNVLKYDKLLNTKELFLAKFSLLISTYSIEIQKKIYLNNYLQLYSNALITNDKYSKNMSIHYLKKKGYYSKKLRWKVFIKYYLKKVTLIRVMRRFYIKLKYLKLYNCE